MHYFFRGFLKLLSISRIHYFFREFILNSQVLCKFTFNSLSFAYHYLFREFTMEIHY